MTGDILKDSAEIFANIQERGLFYLIRIKDSGKSTSGA